MFNFMKKIGIISAIFMLFLLTGTRVQAQKTGDILGVWLNADKDAHVEIYQQGNKYFGKIIWMKEPIDPATGKPKTDVLNPEPTLQSRPKMGLVLLTDFVFDDDEWTDGEIYDPKSGKTYSCYMEFEDLADMNTLKIRGYIGVSLVGKTTYWTRVINK
jgi:uncharacterized protein (DUF2147 family)